MIDCQNTYTRGPLELDGVQAALDQAEELLDRARSAGIPIIHVQHDAGVGSPYDVRGGDRCDRRPGRPARGRADDRQELPELVHRHRLDALLTQGSGAAAVARRVHDPHVRELDRTGRVQPGLRADGGRGRDGHPGPARHRRGGSSRPPRMQAASLASIADLFGVVVADVQSVPE